MTRFASAGEFRLSLQRFKDLTREQFALAHQAVTIHLHSALQEGNPVKTGRSRAGWTASAGSPSAREPIEMAGFIADPKARLSAERTHFERQAALASAEAQSVRVEFGGSTFVVTNVDYTEWINARHPRRGGFVEAALENTATKYQLGSGAISRAESLGAPQ